MATAESQATPRRTAVAAALGVLSVALLGASFVWAHHWGTRTDTLVIAWAMVTVGAFVVSIRLLRSHELWPTRLALRLARIGLAGGVVSILALVVAGIAYGAGISPAGARGGG